MNVSSSTALRPDNADKGASMLQTRDAPQEDFTPRGLVSILERIARLPVNTPRGDFILQTIFAPRGELKGYYGMRRIPTPAVNKMRQGRSSQRQ